MSTDGQIQLTLDGPVATLTIDRPSRRNALHGPMWEAIGVRATEAAEAGARVLILTGAGDHFCSGMDLKPDNPLAMEIVGVVSNKDTAAGVALIERIKGWLKPLADFPGLTIAAIEGTCLGGGLELALHCDVRVASRSAALALPEPRWGMVPDVGGTSRLTRLVGPGRAALVIASGRRFRGDEARDLGIVEVVCDSGGALMTAQDLAADAVRSAPTALREALELVRAVPGLSAAEANAAESAAGAAALVSGEVIEWVSAFAEKREPNWG